MRDDRELPLRRPVRHRIALPLGLFLLGGAGIASAAGESFHGAAEVQFQTIDRTSYATQDSWNKILQLDYANGLPGAIQLSSSFRFVEQTISRQSDRVRVPEGSLRLAHPNFGLSTSYRPSETRDARRFVTRQQDLNVTAYAQKDKLPRLAGSWVRSHLDPTALTPGTATVTRSLASQYALPHLSFRAGYGDRFLESVAGARPRSVENHVSLGSSSQFQLGRAPISFQYDFSQARASASADRSQRSRAHLAGASTNLNWGPRTTSALSYNYRRTQLVGVARSLNQEHNGSLSLSHTLNPVVQLSAGGGVRSAVLSGRDQTERFLAATATAQGQARPGWRLSAAATHSVNWLPSVAARPADNLQTTTTMRLARGLDLRGDFSVSTARPVVTPPETTAFPRQVAVQSGVGLSAAPLRTVSLDASLSKSRAGTSLTHGGITANSYSTGLRLTPGPGIQMSGRWGLTVAPGSRGSTVQGALQWMVSTGLQVSAGYSRSRQNVTLTGSDFTTEQEGLNGSMTLRLAQDLNASVRYNEINRGQLNGVQQLTVHLVRRFGT